MTNDQAIIAKAKRMGMFEASEVAKLVSKVLFDAREFNSNYFELNLREKAEFEWQWLKDNVFQRVEEWDNLKK